MNEYIKMENYEDICEPESMRKLFIGGLDYSTTDETLKTYFEKWGKIVDVVVMKDSQSKRSRGFGFVTYSRSYMIDDVQAKRPHKIDGRVVEPKRAVPREEITRPEIGTSVNKIFVGGLDDDFDKEDLQEYFSKFGTISFTTIVTDRGTGRTRGFGFVEFDDYDPVDKIILQKKHTIKSKLLNVKKALPKEEIDRFKNDYRLGKSRRKWNNNRGGGGGNWGSNRGDVSWNSSNVYCNWSGSRDGSNFDNNGGGNNWSNDSFGANWNNFGNSWVDNGPNNGVGNNWSSTQVGGGGWGNNQGGNWANNDNFGSNYQQNYGGGPQRGGGNNRSTPYNSGGNQGDAGNRRR